MIHLALVLLSIVVVYFCGHIILNIIRYHWKFFLGLTVVVIGAIVFALAAMGVFDGKPQPTSHADASQRTAPSIAAPSSSSLDALPTDFTCDKTHSPAEKLICGDVYLAKLDRDLAPIFARAKAAAPDKRAFAAMARQNWNWRNKNCTDKACLVTWYDDQQRWLLAILNSPVQATVDSESPQEQPLQQAAATPSTSPGYRVEPVPDLRQAPVVEIESSVQEGKPVVLNDLLEPTCEAWGQAALFVARKKGILGAELYLIQVDEEGNCKRYHPSGKTPEPPIGDLDHARTIDRMTPSEAQKAFPKRLLSESLRYYR